MGNRQQRGFTIKPEPASLNNRLPEPIYEVWFADPQIRICRKE
jgi:hypothetical protein